MEREPMAVTTTHVPDVPDYLILKLGPRIASHPSLCPMDSMLARSLFLRPMCGPSVSALVQLAFDHEELALTLSEFGEALGLGRGNAPNSKIAQVIGRTLLMQVADLEGYTLMVRRNVAMSRIIHRTTRTPLMTRLAVGFETLPLREERQA